MRMLRTTLVGITAAATLAVSAVGAQGPQIRLTPLSSIRFPDRGFVITTSKPVVLTGAQVHVRENGKAVGGISVVPASGTPSRTFGVVLLLDASNSMRGRAMTEAVAAARTFVARRGTGEAIGLVTFNSRILAAGRPTTDAKQMADSLRAVPALAEGTRLWDAAGRAIAMLREAKITVGSIVLLTDGRDIGSSLTAQQVASRAQAAGVRIFAVGLRSSQFSPGPLRQVAGSTHGAYSEARSPSSLAAIYASLSTQLAREYLLRYRSGANPGKNVRVDVSVAGAGGSAGWSYRTPEAPSTPTAPFSRSWLDRLVSSPASIALVGLLVAALAALGVISILKPRRSTIRSRVGEFVGVAAPTTARRSLLERATSGLLLGAERALERSPSWERFVNELEIGEFPVRPVPLAVGTAAASIALALFGVISPVLALLALAPPLAVRVAYRDKLRRRRLAFEEQLTDNLTVLAASLRAGHGFVSGLSAVVQQAEEPSRAELARAVADDQLGVPIEEGLQRVADRMASGDLEQVALVAALQRQTGGNTAEVLDAVVETIRQRFQLRRLVNALTAQGRIARWVLTALPIVVAGWISLVNPHYMAPLLHTGIGQVLLTLAVVMVVLGSYIVKRITEIEI